MLICGHREVTETSREGNDYTEHEGRAIDKVKVKMRQKITHSEAVSRIPKMSR